MLNSTARRGAFGALLLLSSASIAFAIPSATYSLQVGTGEDYSSNSHETGTLTSTAPMIADNVGGSDPSDPGSAFASGQITAGTDPTVTVSTTSAYTSGESSYDSIAIATLTYDIFALPPTGSTATTAEIDLNGTYSQNVDYGGNEAGGGPTFVSVGNTSIRASFRDNHFCAQHRREQFLLCVRSE